MGIVLKSKYSELLFVSCGNKKKNVIFFFESLYEINRLLFLLYENYMVNYGF